MGRLGHDFLVRVADGVCGADVSVRLGGGVGGRGAYAVGRVRRRDGGELVCGVVDSGIAVVPFLQEALTFVLFWLFLPHFVDRFGLLR